MCPTVQLPAEAIEGFVVERVRSYGEVAQRMGVSQPRVSMLVALTFLCPRIQEVILAGEVGLGFRTLLKLARLDAWKEQEALAGGAGIAVGRQIQQRLKGAPHRRASHRYGGSYLETHIEGREIG